MRAVLLFNYYFERYINFDSDCTELFDMFSSTDSILALTEKINHLDTNYNSKVKMFLVIQEISKIIDYLSISEYLSFGRDFLRNQNMENLGQLWTYKNYMENEIDMDHIHEQYGVYYISMYYMNFFKDKQPYKFIVQFFTLFYLQSCFEVLMYNKNKGQLMLADVIEIYTKIARAYEHSLNNQKLETTFSVFEKNKMTSLAFLMSLV